MSSESPVIDEVRRNAERMKELISSKSTLSEGKAERIYKTILSTVPENTSQETIMEIIYAADGNMKEIERRIAEVWEEGMMDDWKKVESRYEKTKKSTEPEQTERQHGGRGQGGSRKPYRRNNTYQSRRNNYKRGPKPDAAPAPQPVEQIEEKKVPQPEVAIVEPAPQVEEAPVEEVAEIAEVAPEVEAAPEVSEPVIEAKVEEVAEVKEEIEESKPEPVVEEVKEEIPAEPVNVVKTVRQTKRVVRKVQVRKHVGFSLGAYASNSISAPISIGMNATTVSEPAPEPAATPAPAPAPASEQAKPKESKTSPPSSSTAPSASPAPDMEYNNMYGYFYPNMYPGYPQPPMFYSEYYPPGMNQDAHFNGVQAPPMFNMPQDKNFSRPAQPMNGMQAPQEQNAPDKVNGMNRENPMMYNQQNNVPFVPYPSYPNNQGYMYGGYPRNMMNHSPQQNYNKQNGQGMFDPRNGGAQQQDSYGSGMQPNRGMMERMDVQQQNMENANKGFFYGPRGQQLGSTWMRNGEGRY